jgi:selenocysteine lyase/cysteine desulfurase
MSPRGTAFATVRPELLERLHPVAAGWFAAEDIHGAYYGMPVRLAADARRLDVSPAWFSWVGTLPALDVVLERGVEAIHAHDLGLANAFREGLGLAPGDSAIVSVGVEGAERRLAGTEVRAAVRAGALRTSWHLYNTIDDVERVLELLHRR